ncbi:ATP-binding protein [Streptomyces sp. H27-C3]|uniref:ATP-binding protein n=1 Tax=Streptomyces sp. H27-C3 TaxID=3046305 RepID=UPI0024B9E87F|nr:ATP-binding protein [Streptomyces sp. H27-C3]MDJ0465619.1 ATP-binding protein [Streptomyces sp. H27-C3]
MVVVVILAAGCAAVAVLLGFWALALYRQLTAERAGRAGDQRVAAARGAAVTQLAAVRVPAIAERVRTGQRLDGVPGPVALEAEVGEEFARALADVVVALGSDEAVRRERALRDSVQAAFESVARNMHAMATVQQQVLDRVERSIDDPRLMAEVMKADHAASQMTRKAQTLLVMCGIWPARRETRPVSLYDCVRGAQSRIVEFGRLDVHGGQTLYVVAPAVEGLMHAIAELLENATVFSPSSTQVVVTIREVGAGAVVEVDDAGLGMPPDVLNQAMGQLRAELDLARLGAVPRLGLACVGRWARELGFKVELTGASAYGGTRAVAFVPHRLLTEPLSHFATPPQAAADTRSPAVAPVPPRRTVEPVPLHQTVAPVVETPPPGRRSDGAPDGVRQPPVPAPDDIRQLRPAGSDDVQQPGAAQQPPGAGLGGLPRRRSRRGAGQAAADRLPRNPRAPQAPTPPSAPWTPEAARASIASVLSGTRRGRAVIDGAEHNEVRDRDQVRDPDQVRDQHDGGRP